MNKGGNGGVIVREFAIIVPLTLPMPGKVEDEIKQLSLTLTFKIPSLPMNQNFYSGACSKSVC